MKKLIPILLLTLTAFATSAYSAVVKVEVEPTRLLTKSIKVHGPHIALVDPEISSNGLLFITIGGTGSKPTDFNVAQQEAVKLGYHVIGVDYPNDVISTTCRDSNDKLCFDKFRNEIMTGNSVSPIVKVDRDNALLTRIELMIRYMNANSKSGQWGQFLNNFGMVNWKNIVVAGHSQGSGHAAYLGKIRPLRAVLMAAGPQDNFTKYGLAEWVKKPGKTAGENYFSLLHEKDFFGVSYQVEVDLALTNQADIAKIGNEVPGNGARILISNLPVSDPHNSVITSQFQAVWQHMLDL